MPFLPRLFVAFFQCDILFFLVLFFVVVLLFVTYFAWTYHPEPFFPLPVLFWSCWELLLTFSAFSFAQVRIHFINDRIGVVGVKVAWAGLRWLGRDKRIGSSFIRISLLLLGSRIEGMKLRVETCRLHCALLYCEMALILMHGRCMW